MNYTYAIACCLLSCLVGTAQQPTLSLQALGRVTIELRNIDDRPLSQSIFSHFQVIDERPDTARIGLHTYVPTFGWNRARQLVFRHPAAVELADYLNTHFTRTGAPYTALIVLRHLWLSDANSLREDLIKDPDKMHERTHSRLKAEIYASKDSLFMPILRYDTTCIYKKDNRYTGESYYFLWEQTLTDLLNDMADQAGKLTPSRADHARRVSLDEIRVFDRSRFDAPIGAAATLTPGVYTSFDEFRNNTPSIHDFEIKKEHKERLLYIKEPGGRTYFSHDAWGYCDGKDIYVMRDGVLCPAWREGNGFYFYGGADRGVIVPQGFVGLRKPMPADPEGEQRYNPSGQTGQGQAMDVKIHAIFMLDMDSGAIY